ncbi:MAG: hypothetical protein PXZ07_06320 [Candidatus Eremiobacteraeota bacterium]|nr:hypothetical protein [Candidatus Eremiobacteraeota bacterium]
MTDNDDTSTHSELPEPGLAGAAPHSPTLAMMDSVIVLGAEKLIGLGAAALIFIGFFAPLVTAQAGGFLSSDGSVSYSLSQAGFPGVLTLTLGLVLALLPFDKGRIEFANRDMITYGVSCGIFGTIAILWLASVSVPAVISSFGGLSVGFYALMAGFALNAYATAKTFKKRELALRP